MADETFRRPADQTDPPHRPGDHPGPADAAADAWGPTTRFSGLDPASPQVAGPPPTQAVPTQASPTQASPTQASPTQASPTQASPPPTQSVPTQAPPPPGPPTPPPTTPGPPPPPAMTDELPLPQRFARRVKRGEQGAAVRDAARTIEAKVPFDFRVAIGTGVLAIAAAIVQQALFPVSATDLTPKLIGYGLALVFLVFGILAVRSAASEVSRVSALKGGASAAQAIRLTSLLVGYLLVILVTLGMVQVSLGNLLVGGALTGVVLGIAAQQALGNIFAGLVLLFTRPYVPGERIRVNSGAIGGPHDGTVVSVGLAYTVLLTDYGPVNIPNAQLLASAIGPQPPADLDPTVDAEDGEETEKAADRRREDDAPPPSAGGAAVPR